MIAAFMLGSLAVGLGFATIFTFALSRCSPLHYCDRCGRAGLHGNRCLHLEHGRVCGGTYQ